ncbi:hypothetical protein EDC01DRAFT_667058 [Geopyxis carbonaria]|nr:hypothetical protein EDC01DRAFT_667058 [Geopyxis carbonaria]
MWGLCWALGRLWRSMFAVRGFWWSKWVGSSGIGCGVVRHGRTKHKTQNTKNNLRTTDVPVPTGRPDHHQQPVYDASPWGA